MFLTIFPQGIINPIKAKRLICAKIYTIFAMSKLRYSVKHYRLLMSRYLNLEQLIFNTEFWN